MHDALTPIVFQRHHNPLRAVLIDRQPWFVASDLCRLLNQRHSERLCRRMDAEQIMTIHLAYRNGGEEQVQVINVAGLYKALYRFHHPEHRQISRWLSQEVIPTLHDQQPMPGNQPRRVLMAWQGTRVGVLDWQGVLWVPLQQLPTFSPWQEPLARRRWFG